MSVGFLVFLPGCCIKKSSYDTQNSAAEGSVVPATLVAQLEAKLVDIAIPINAVAIEQDIYYSAHETKNITLYYHVDMDGVAWSEFYQKEMERMGWRQLLSCTGREQVIVFDRPARICVISIRPEKHGMRLSLFTGPKNKI
jgi:hypothetical protein